ncbi:MAG: ABC transporter ATP-binding protein [Oscillospiraceae bacterium]|nr:ABC transporter ATP-binding protein [Oscillospiraceae bacterium]
MENCIEIKNVSRSYPQFELKNISFNVPYGSVVGFIGENGAGKSTTIKAILGLLKKGEGTITVLGEDADNLSAATKEKIGVVFDGLSFPENLNVKQLDKVMRGIYKTWDSAKFFGLMSKFELPLNKKFKSFSRGMVMRLSIAAALSHATELLVLDEPTSGLDPVMRSDILDIFLDFMQDEKHSILISTHITSDLDHIADYICFIHKGEIVFTEERNEMIERHRILKCTDEQLAVIDKSDIIGVRRGRFQNEVLTCAADKYPDIAADVPTIEEIMVFYVRD